MTAEQWADRAAAAERAVTGRHVRRAWGLPGTWLGVNGWPPTVKQRLFLGWNYWWQAHLLDCLLDAERRDPQRARRRGVSGLIRGIRLANGGRWTNDYYDDMAWLGLALDRADGFTGSGDHRAVRRLTGAIIDGWSADQGGGIPWRRGDEFKNVPANGPAAILLARTGHLDRACATADWLDERLRDPVTGLFFDGLRPADDGGTRYERTIYTYCQGVVIGAEYERAVRVPGDRAQATRRISRLLAAVAEHLTVAGVLTGHQGGDSGLFTGILARYLALVATDLPGDAPVAVTARRSAADLVLRSARAAWDNAVPDPAGRPLFGPDWSRSATAPRQRRTGATRRRGRRDGGTQPEADLSVQLSGWMLLEAAALVSARPPPGAVG